MLQLNNNWQAFYFKTEKVSNFLFLIRRKILLADLILT